MRRHTRLTLAAAGTVALALGAVPPALAAVGTGQKGPSTTVSPYVLPRADGVEITSLLTVGDLPATNGYKMVGIPDGLGARNSATAGKLELFMNHELASNQGIVARARPDRRVRLEPHDRQGDAGRGQRQGPRPDAGDISYWNYPAGAYQATPSPAGGPFAAQPAPFNRFCSGTLTDPGQLLNAISGNGYSGQIYFGNEEGGNESRTFGILADDGTTKQLPRLGLFSWENTIPARQPLGHDARPRPGGRRRGPDLGRTSARRRTPATRSTGPGLTNGTNNVVDLLDEAVDTDAEFRATYGKGVPVPFNLDPVDWNQPGSAQNAEAATDGHHAQPHRGRPLGPEQPA